MSNILAVFKSDDGLFSIAWAGGIPLCVAVSRGEAVAALRQNTELSEAEIQSALNAPQASASTFQATAWAGTTAEVTAIADTLETLPTSSVTAELSGKLEKVIDTVAALAAQSGRQEKQLQLRDLEEQSNANLQRKFDSLADLRLTHAERAGIVTHHYANDFYGLQVAALRRELAQ